MSFTNQDIYKALETITEPGEGKSLIENKNISNLVVFGSEVIVDVSISNPALQAKKKIELEIKKAIHSHVDEKIDVKVNVKSIAPPKKEQDSNLIKGKKIPNIQNIIAVASGKGGVGKSTITANTAISLAKMGFKVGVLDADIYGPSMHLMFDVEKERPISVTIDGRSKMKPVENYGVKLLSLGFFTNPDQAVIWRGPMLMGALQQMLNQVKWGELDVLLIDLPPGTGDVQLTLSQKTEVSGSIIVSTPQDVALLDARKAINMFNRMEVPIIGMIENMSSYHCPKCGHEAHIFGHGGAREDAKKFELPFLGEIPLELEIREAGDGGIPVAATDSKHAAAYLAIAQRLIDSDIL